MFAVNVRLAFLVSQIGNLGLLPQEGLVVALDPRGEEVEGGGGLGV